MKTEESRQTVPVVKPKHIFLNSYAVCTVQTAFSPPDHMAAPRDKAVS